LHKTKGQRAKLAEKCHLIIAPALAAVGALLAGRLLRRLLGGLLLVLGVWHLCRLLLLRRLAVLVATAIAAAHQPKRWNDEGRRKGQY
jgi:hypothetical protein